jgi:hypothetical protein
MYLLRNSAYMYIQCMGTQMRYFVESVVLEDIEMKTKEKNLVYNHKFLD